MFRLTLVSYLTAVMLAGPALCCCQASDLFGAMTPSSREDQPDRPASRCHGHHAGRSCHAHRLEPVRHGGNAGRHKNMEPSNAPDAPAHPCSCHESRLDALIVKVNDADVASLLRLQVEFCDGFAIAALSHSMVTSLLNAVIASLGSTTFPHMSAPVILRALQTFRC